MCFDIRERQLGRSQFGQPSVCSPAAQRQPRVRPGPERHLASRWQALGEIADGLVAAPLCHEVKVVEDEHEGQLTGGAGIDQRRQYHVLDRWLRAAEVIGQRRVELQDRIERSDHCRDQCDRIVVSGLEGDPGEGPLVPVSPQGQQRRLAVAGWRGEEDDRVVGHREEAADQSRTVHDPRGAAAPPACWRRSASVRRSGRVAVAKRHLAAPPDPRGLCNRAAGEPNAVSVIHPGEITTVPGTAASRLRRRSTPMRTVRSSVRRSASSFKNHCCQRRPDGSGADLRRPVRAGEAVCAPGRNRTCDQVLRSHPAPNAELTRLFAGHRRAMQPWLFRC